MSFFILIGKQDFDSAYHVQDLTVLPTAKEIIHKPPICKDGDYYCPNCRNVSVNPIKRKEFITLFFIPVVPIYWGKQLHCSVCDWRQDFKNEAELLKVKNETVRVLS